MSTRGRGLPTESVSDSGENFDVDTSESGLRRHWQPYVITSYHGLGLELAYSMSVPIFPPEILDLFLDELGLAIGDRRSRAALLACTLVNRQFYFQASAHLFSSLSISTHRSPERLNALLDILNKHPDLARRIRSFTIESLKNRLDSAECLSAVFRQLYHLQKFGWTGNFAMPDETTITAITSSICPSLCNFPYLTALHLKSIRNFPLSFFSACRHLESLTLIRVLFAKVGPETRSDSLFSSLRKLKISGGGLWQRDMDAIRIIMTRAAPSLTTLILSQTRLNDCRYGNILDSNACLSPP